MSHCCGSAYRHLTELQKPTTLPQAEVSVGRSGNMGDTGGDMMGLGRNLRNLEA